MRVSEAKQRAIIATLDDPWLGCGSDVEIADEHRVPLHVVRQLRRELAAARGRLDYLHGQIEWRLLRLARARDDEHAFYDNLATYLLDTLDELIEQAEGRHAA